MARTWHSPADRRHSRRQDRQDRQHRQVDRRRPNWWLRHWADPSFSGGLIAVVSVLLVIAVGLAVGVQALGLDLGHLDLGHLFGR